MSLYNIYNLQTIDNDGYSDELPDGWRVYHVTTGNDMDSCYVDMPADMDEGEREDEIRWALRYKFGRRYGFTGYEDVTDLYRKG